METNQASITALVTAYARAYHATHDSPVIFDDSLADQMYTKDEHVIFDKGLAGMIERLKELDPTFVASKPDQATALSWVIQCVNGPVAISRARYAEDTLEEAIQHGVQQYVILGAGFDTFAFRRPDLVAQLQVFEVDHPATQAAKRQRITIPGWVIPPQLHFVPVDFNKESLTAALQRSSYDPRKLTLFSWQGVTYYLTRDVVFATLQSIASIAPKGSTILFDYIDADAFIPGRVAVRMQLMQSGARQAGEPMKSGFDPLLLGVELARLGLTLQENLSPADIERRYFQGRSDLYHAFEHVYFANALITHDK